MKMSDLHDEIMGNNSLLNIDLKGYTDEIYVIVGYTEITNRFENICACFNITDALEEKQRLEKANSGSLFFNEYQEYMIDKIKIVD